MSNLAAVTGALGEAVNELVGLRFTRLTAPVAVGNTSFPVESTFGWPDTGAFYLDGIRYTYTGKTPTTLTGVTWPDASLQSRGEMAAPGDTVELAVVSGVTVEIQVTGRWEGQLDFEGSTDGTTWAPISALPPSGPGVASTTANGSWTVAVGALLYVRVNASALSLGAAKALLKVFAGTGAKVAHLAEAQVVDGSRTYSCLDLTRGQFFVDSAAGDRLDALGRNLGVKRPPELISDSNFREIIKAMAYSPKGTLYAIEQALTAFFGKDNFRIWENFPTYRNTVFIELLNGIALSDTADGQAYLAKNEIRPLGAPVPLAANQVSVTETLTAVRGVRLAPEDATHDLLEGDKPSAIIETRYPGDPAPAPYWAFNGTNEAADVVMDPAEGAVITNPAGRVAEYYRTARLEAESTAAITVTVKPTSLGSSLDTRNYVVAIRDGSRNIGVGLSKLGPDAILGFINPATGAPIAGITTATIPGTDFSDITLKKVGTTAQLLVNGVLIDTKSTLLFPATTANDFRWGHPLSTVNSTTSTKTVTFHAETPLDYWNSRGAAGQANIASPTTFDTNSGIIQGGDVDKTFRTTGAVARAGSGASITLDSGIIYFVSGLHGVSGQDSGKWIVLSNTDDPNNFGIFQIVSTFSSTTVRISNVLGSTDLNNGSINWGICSLSGNWEVDTVLDADRVTLRGALKQEAFVESGLPQVISLEHPDLVYPDDLGKNLEILSGPNAGTYPIVALLDANGDPLNTTVNEIPTATPQTIPAQKALVAGAPALWTTDTDLEWRLHPKFGTRASLSWELVASGTLAALTLTLRSPPSLQPPAYQVILDVGYSHVASSQVMADPQVANDPVGTWHPGYLPQHPFGPYASYLDELTVAGVIPEVVVS